MKVIMKEYVVGRLLMKSGMWEQQKIDLWDYDTDSSGNVWLWPHQHKEPGAMVHVGSITVGKRSDGYGGQTLSFPTKDGIIIIQGPWHSNPDALYAATGVDLRDKHLTFGVISLDRGSDDYYNTVMKEVLYIDPEEGVVGYFDRIKQMAEKIALEMNCCLYYYSQSSSGSSCGPVNWEAGKEKVKP